MNCIARTIFKRQKIDVEQETISLIADLYYAKAITTKKREYLVRKCRFGWIQRLVDKMHKKQYAFSEGIERAAKRHKKPLEYIRLFHPKKIKLPKTIEREIKNVVLEGEDMGNYLITIDIANAYYPEASGGNYQMDGYCHPHMHDGGDICLGNASKPYINSINMLDFEAALDVVEAVVREYNPEDAYIQLYDLTDSKRCQNCGTPDYDSEVYFCSYCDEETCLDCANKCQECDRILCASCTIKEYKEHNINGVKIKTLTGSYCRCEAKHCQQCKAPAFPPKSRRRVCDRCKYTNEYKKRMARAML